MSKIVAKSKYSEWTGLVRIREVVALEMKCIYRETSSDDFGIDGTIEVCIPTPDGQALTKGGIVNFQSKAGKKYVTGNSDEGFYTPVERNDLEYWASSNVPVIFIVFHPPDDRLYFVDIKDYIRNHPDVYTKPHKVHFDKSIDVFDATAYDTLCRLAETMPPAIDFTRSERLFSNLFPVVWHVRDFTSAPTTYISREEIFYDFNSRTKSEKKFRLPPFFLFEDRLYTLADLRDPKNLLREFCDVLNITDHNVFEWLEVDDDADGERAFGGRDEFEDLDFVRERESIDMYARSDRQRKKLALRSNVLNLFNQLLGKHLAERGLEYNRDFKRSYFPRAKPRPKAFKQKWSSIRTGANDERTVCKYYEYGGLTFWRHEALSAGFRVHGDRVYLEIEPKLLFTQDGETPSPSALVGPYSTRHKARRFNSQVLNDVLFWASVMGAKIGHDIEMKVDQRTLIQVSSEPVIFAANFAISQKTRKKNPSKGSSTQGSKIINDDEVLAASATKRTNGNRSRVRTKKDAKFGARGTQVRKPKS
jgi:hypothetical protein